MHLTYRSAPSPAESNRGSWMLIRAFSGIHTLKFPHVICTVDLNFFAVPSPSSCITNCSSKHSQLLVLPGCVAAEKVCWLGKVAGVAGSTPPACACTCAPLHRCYLSCEQACWWRWDGAGWHSAELHGKESGVLCLWTQTSVGQTGFDRRHHRQKNNKIRNHPSHSSPALPSPFISQLSVNSCLCLFLFNSPPHSLLTTFPQLSIFVLLFNTTSPLLPHRPII